MPQESFGFWKRFGYGAAGALAHEAVRVYKLVADPEKFPKFSPAYYVLIAVLIVLGGSSRRRGKRIKPGSASTLESVSRFISPSGLQFTPGRRGPPS